MTKKNYSKIQPHLISTWTPCEFFLELSLKNIVYPFVRLVFVDKADFSSRLTF